MLILFLSQVFIKSGKQFTFAKINYWEISLWLLGDPTSFLVFFHLFVVSTSIS